MAPSSEHCSDIVRTANAPWVTFGAPCFTVTAASNTDTPAGQELEFNEECLWTFRRGKRMTVDEAMLEIDEEAEWRAENGPGAAYTASEAEWYDQKWSALEEQDRFLRAKTD